MTQKPKAKIKIATWNVNGLRSVAGKGFLNWLAQSDCDIVCLQETKVRIEQLADQTELQNPPGYSGHFYSAQKPGYSGLICYVRRGVNTLGIRKGIGLTEFDDEARVQAIEFDEFILANCYFPNSQRDHGRLDYKLRFCSAVDKFTRLQKKPVIICGDFNIAHKEIDLKNPKTNVNNAGFLPEERAWLDGFIARGYADAFRTFEKSGGHYTWWSYRPGVREKNVGWRLDYFLVPNAFMVHVKAVKILPEVKGSDHCPVVMELQNT